MTEFLVLRSGSTWEIRVVRHSYARRIARAVLAGWQRLLRARREHAEARLLAELDSRLLKDIGLEPHHGSSLAARVAGYRRRELTRIMVDRLGL